MYPDAFSGLVFNPSRPGILEGFIELTTHALDGGWDHNTLIIQDDVTTPDLLPSPIGDITSYHTRRGPYHVCPRAFSASPLGWQRLNIQWSEKTARACVLWRPDHCYDVATHSPQPRGRKVFGLGLHHVTDV